MWRWLRGAARPEQHVSRVNERYPKERPMPLSTSRPLAALVDVLQDGQLAEAILDRIPELRARFDMRGRSYAFDVSPRTT